MLYALQHSPALMATIFIFHGIGGTPQEHWFPWLKRELEQGNHTVIVPQFPHTDAPQLTEWLAHFTQYEPLPKDSVFVGHSLGGMFALRLLENLEASISATVLVASVTDPSDGAEYQPLMTSFTTQPLDWKKIRANAGSVSVLHADNDPYIPLEHAEKLASNLKANFTVIPDGGHLNQSTGYEEFPLLMERIQAVL